MGGAGERGRGGAAAAAEGGGDGGLIASTTAADAAGTEAAAGMGGVGSKPTGLASIAATTGRLSPQFTDDRGSIHASSVGLHLACLQFVSLEHTWYD